MLFLGCLMVGILVPMHGHACVINNRWVPFFFGFLLKQEPGFRWKCTAGFFAIKEAAGLSKKLDNIEANQSSSDNYVLTVHVSALVLSEANNQTQSRWSNWPS